MDKLKDTDPMPFGKYQGISMANVPAEYLIFLWDMDNFRYQSGKKVKEYIKENLEVLQKEAKNGNKQSK